MNLVCWKIRGLDDPVKQSEIQKIVNRTTASMLGITENKLRIENVDRVMKKCLPNWHYVHNGSICSVCRVIYCWKNDMTCSVLKIHK